MSPHLSDIRPKRGGWYRAALLAIFATAAALLVVPLVAGQEPTTAPVAAPPVASQAVAARPEATQAIAAPHPAPCTAVTLPAATQAAGPTPAEFYGAWVLVPPLVTIVLAIVLRQVIPALVIGVFIAAYMLIGCAAGGAYGGGLVGGVRLALERFVLGSLVSLDHVKIIVFTLMIGGMIGVIAANGGTPAVVAGIARWAGNRRGGQIVTWFAGLLVFFDDYANAMIIGPAMRPVCDRLRISRAKLAYIVDSTAAPVSSIVIISTWLGAEIGFIHDGLRGISQTPAFLAGMELDKGFAYSVFWASIPYRFYPILALVLVFLLAVFDRDFGPMLKAERDPERAGGAVAGTTQDLSSAARGRAWYAIVPVLLLVCVTLSLLVITGLNGAREDGVVLGGGLDLVRQVVSNADSYNSMLYGTFAALVAAVVISLGTRALSLGRTMDSATDSMCRMLPTLIVLTLAWSLSSAMQALELGEVARNLLQQAQFDPRWLPLLIFLAACVVSFSTGTSWGTMGILCPATVTIAAGLLVDTPAEQAWPLFYAAVGSVLAGAVFGDHCSPISDTTVLSALASSCSLERHVWTQIPYALVAGGVAMLSGEVLCREFDLSPWVGLLVGSALLTLIVRFVGRRVTVAASAAA